MSRLFRWQYESSSSIHIAKPIRKKKGQKQPPTETLVWNMVKLYWVMLWRLRRSWLLLKRTTCTKYRKPQHADQHRDGRPTIRHSQIPKMKIKHDRYQFDYWLPCKEWECNSNRLLVRFLPLNPGRTPGAHAFTKVEFKTPYKFAFFLVDWQRSGSHRNTGAHQAYQRSATMCRDAIFHWTDEHIRKYYHH